MDFKAEVEKVQRLAQREGVIDSEPIKAEVAQDEPDQSDSIKAPGDRIYGLLLKEDPNLALVAIRIDLERQLRAAACAVEEFRYASLRKIVEYCHAAHRISDGDYKVLKEILPILNQAAHALPIDITSAETIVLIGANLIKRLKNTLL